MITLHMERHAIAAELRSYGEDECAARIADLPDDAMQRIAVIAGEHSVAPVDNRSGRGMLLAKAVALAAVEVIEGRPRQLRRKRRRFDGVQR